MRWHPRVGLSRDEGMVRDVARTSRVRVERFRPGPGWPVYLPLTRPAGAVETD